MGSPWTPRSTPEHACGTPRARRRAHHLVTADEHSLLDLEAFLATLPLCASGRIFIEVPDASDIGVIHAPGRMTVTWLARSARLRSPGHWTRLHPGSGAGPSHVRMG